MIQIVNAQIQANSLCDSRFSGGAFFGVAYDGGFDDGKIYPVVQNTDGEQYKVNPDDTYNIQIYHKILGKTYSINKNSTGNRANKVDEKTEVKMVVAGWTNKLGVSQEDLETLIASNFPDQLANSLYASLKLDNLTIVLGGANMDKSTVFKEEYKGFEYHVKPEQILFSMRYSINATYKKGCFTLTDCQPTGVLT